MRSLASLPAAILGTALAAGTAGHAAAAGDEQFVVIKAGTVVTVDGEAIPRGEIVIVDGTIRLVGKGLDYPADATIIDARDETVMPGWVHPTTRHDLPLHRRTGVNGNIVVAGETMLSEVDLSPLAEAGVTAVGAYPSGSGIPGVASVFRTMPPVGLDQDDQRSQVLLDESYLRIVMRGAGGEKDRLAGALRKAKSEIDKVEKARADFEKKKAEAEAKAKAAAEAKKDGEKKDGEGAKKDEEAATFKPPATDPTHAPLIAWIKGELAVRPLIEISGPSDLLHLAEVLEAHKDLSPANLMLAAGFGSDFSPVLEQLADRDAIVLTTLDLGRLPQTATVTNLPAALAAAGVELALTPEAPATGGGGFRGGGRRGGRPAPRPVAGSARGNAAAAIATMRSRLAMLVRNGLDRDAALRAITINPARLLGVDDRIGSIAAGKDADLVFLDGDALDPLSEVTRVMILGEIVWEADK